MTHEEERAYRCEHRNTKSVEARHLVVEVAVTSVWFRRAAKRFKRTTR